MELDLGLKLTSIADGFTSDFKIAKDHAGPVFVSRETDAMFFLTAHLKGYKRRNIKIDINEDGSLIEISGEKQVQETVIVGWKVHKKEREIKGFKKVFRIPRGVILDKIKAKFDDESTLTVTMPKMVKGVRGTVIEEVKDKPELVRAGSGSLQIAEEKSPKAGTSNLETAETSSKARVGEDESADKKPSDGGEAKPEEEKHEQKPLSVHDLNDGEREGEAEQQVSPSIHGEVARVEAGKDEEKQESTGDIQEITEPKQHEDTYKQVPGEKSDEGKLGSSAIEPSEEASVDKPEVQDDEERPQRFKLCMPIVAGSTLLLTFVVFVIQMMRSKPQTCRRRD